MIDPISLQSHMTDDVRFYSYMTKFISLYESLDHSVSYVIKSSKLPKYCKILSLLHFNGHGQLSSNDAFSPLTLILDIVQESEWTLWHTNMHVLVRINIMVIKNVSITLCWLSV